MLEEKFKVSTLCVGEIRTNCYFISNDKKTIVVDPGAEADRISRFMEQNQLEPVAILLTHGHFDHILAAKELGEKYSIKIYALEEEKALLENPVLNLSTTFYEAFTGYVDVTVKDGEVLELAGLKVKVLHTPGHTMGSACYYLEEQKVLISGDLIFNRSVGRTDFPTSNEDALVLSIKEKVFTLPDGVSIYPGHGRPTNVGDEKMMNVVNRYL